MNDNNIVLKVGTLDTLVALSEELTKLDVYVEGYEYL